MGGRRVLQVHNTARYVGIELRGDVNDLQALYDALHQVIGNEEEFHMEPSRLRVLGVCYDLRHAIMGDAAMDMVESGLDRDRMQWMQVIGPTHNLYWSFPVFWPEIIYVVLVLNRFVDAYAKTLVRGTAVPLLHSRAFLEPSIAQVRCFQSLVIQALLETVPPPTKSRVATLVRRGAFLEVPQYVDVLNTRWVAMSPEDRIKSLSVMVKRLVEPPNEYQRIRDQAKRFAIENQCRLEDVNVGRDYPERIDW